MLALTLLVCTVAANGDGRVKNAEFTVPETSYMETISNRHTLYETGGTPIENFLTTDGFEKKIETDILAVWFRDETDNLRIIDKRSGYIWGSLLEDAPEGFNQNWCEMANAICTISYFDKENVERKISTNNRNVKSVFTWESNKLTCDVNIKKISLSFSFTMSVNADTVEFEMVKNSLKETEENRIKSLYFAPFLGCTKEDNTEGYIFIPDGPGALIRYREKTAYVSGFEEKIYGDDMGVDSLSQANDLMASRSNDYLVETPQVTMPVFGMVHGTGQNALFAIVQGGDENASIIANPAGVITDYNWVTVQFNYRQMYVHPTSKDGAGVSLPQAERNAISPKISYHFLSGQQADYSGMAVFYKEWLKQRKMMGTERKDTTLPLLLNVLGAEVKKEFLGNSLTVFTTADRAKQMADRLESKGITNLSLVLEGWQKGGINGNAYGTEKFEKKVGSKTEIKNLQKQITDNGGRFYLLFNPITANEDQISKSKQASVTLSKTFASFVRPNTNVMYYERFLIKPRAAAAALNNNTKKNDEFTFKLDGIGNRLYSDATRNKVLSRGDTLALYTKAVSDIKNKPAAGTANLYMWKYVAELSELPIVNSQYLFETDTVPFLQMVLKGSLDYYAPYSNQGFYSPNSILKMVEYGTYPSFIVSNADNVKLKDTPIEDLFTVNFGDWEEMMVSIHQRLSKALLPVEGREIESHKMIVPGVAKVTYEGGIAIYINYNASNYTGDGITVKGLDFFVKG